LHLLQIEINSVTIGFSFRSFNMILTHHLGFFFYLHILRQLFHLSFFLLELFIIIFFDLDRDGFLLRNIGNNLLFLLGVLRRFIFLLQLFVCNLLCLIL